MTEPLYYDSQEVPAGEEDRVAGTVEHHKEIDLDRIHTRKERLGYGPSEKVSRFMKEARSWAKNVLCPVCNTQMIMLKGRRGRYGDIVTYQCWANTEPGKTCLAVVTVSLGSNYLMRPGDFEASDIDWESIAQETVPVEEGDVIKQSMDAVEDITLPSETPPSPWNRKVMSRSIWECFWRLAFEKEGQILRSELEGEIYKERPGDKEGKAAFRLRRELDNLPNWMTNRTGFLVKQRGEVYMILGKVTGRLDLFPYSNKEYRQRNGLGQGLD